MKVKLSEILGAGFGVSRQALRQGAGEIIEAGGRGSGKSSYISIELVLQLLKHPDIHAVVVRKVANTLRTSVFAQLRWAVEQLGLTPLFRVSLSPLELEYLPTEQKILFFGLDDAGKLKSLKLHRGYVGLLWFEELDQFEPEEVRSCEQSVLRGGDFSISFKSFNPPPEKAHWVNRLEEKEGRFLHHSTYLQLPPHWLGRRFLEDAEHLRQTNPVLYNNEYLGLPVGEGTVVFPNLRLESFTHSTQGAVCGVDWGWYPDPWAFDRVVYDPRENRLYVLREDEAVRASNGETARRIGAVIPTGELILADAAEPKSIADYRAAGLNCRAAAKGPGSVRYGIKWLQSLDAIVIDPAVCPQTAREFAGCRYGKNGILPGEDHHIDAVRYACSHLWRKGRGVAW